MDVSLANKIEMAQFYAETAADYCFETIPGVKVNEKLQVLDGNGDAIEGLFASGEATIGNVLTQLYAQAGTGLTWASATGTYAGDMIAEYICK